MRQRAILAVVVLFTLGGCARSFQIIHEAGGNDGAYITFPAGTPLHEGEIYRIVGAIPPQGHGRTRPVLGKVQVLSLKSDNVAFVKVLEGTVENGVTAEKE